MSIRGDRDRGPDPDAPLLGDQDVDRIVRLALKYGGNGNHGHGAVNGSSRILTALVFLNTALLVGVGGWLLMTVSQHDRDIAVIKCQLDTQCREVLRGRP